MSLPKWDIRIWLIGILTILIISIGGYVMKSLAGELAQTTRLAVSLAERQAVDDERFLEFRGDMKEIKDSIKDVRDLLIRTHMQELKKERLLTKN
jgi:hypothetical protein